MAPKRNNVSTPNKGRGGSSRANNTKSTEPSNIRNNDKDIITTLFTQQCKTVTKSTPHDSTKNINGGGIIAMGQDEFHQCSCPMKD